MKKFTFILAALFAANMVNAQIYLEKTVNGRMSNWLDMEDFYFDCGKLPIVYGDTVVELYNDDMTLYKTVRFASTPKAPNRNTVKRSPSAYMGGHHQVCFYLRETYIPPMEKSHLFDGAITTLQFITRMAKWFVICRKRMKPDAVFSQ